jgi:hypothetical protein
LDGEKIAAVKEGESEESGAQGHEKKQERRRIFGGVEERERGGERRRLI